MFSLLVSARLTLGSRLGTESGVRASSLGSYVGDDIGERSSGNLDIVVLVPIWINKVLCKFFSTGGGKKRWAEKREE